MTQETKAADYSTNGEKPPTLEQAFKKLHSEEKYHDIVLLSNDGMKYPTNRAALATRNSVFDKMLFGEFCENKKETVQCGYKGSVVKVLLDYIFTGDSEILVSAAGDDGGNNHARIHDLVELAVAAGFYDAPELGQRVCDCLAGILEQEAAMSFTLWQACHQHGPAVPENLANMAKSVVRTMALFNPGAFATLSHHDLRELFQDKVAMLQMMNQAKCFEIVRVWAAGADARCGSEENTSFIAAKLVKDYILLEKIHPEFLATTVKTSGLVSEKRLNKAFKKQLLQGFNGFDKPPTGGAWESTGSTSALTFGDEDCLNWQPVTQTEAKEHQWTWTFKVEECGPGAVLWLGLVDTCFFWKPNMGGCIVNDFLGTNSSDNSNLVAKCGEEVKMSVRSSPGAKRDHMTIQLEFQAKNVSVTSEKLDRCSTSFVPIAFFQDKEPGGGTCRVRIVDYKEHQIKEKD